MLVNSSETKAMKILVYGQEPLMKKVASILTVCGIEIIGISHTEEIQTVLEHCEKPHMALIDKKGENAVSTNDYIQELWDIPTVLIIGKDKEDWQGLERFMASGYVQDTYSNKELAARLYAIDRRTTSLNEGRVS
jgi:hypothetical protein